MASVTNLQVVHNNINIIFDDGSALAAYPAGSGIYFVDTGVDTGAGGDTGGGEPPAPGTYSVIFPCAVHNVSDSYAAHVARGSVNPGTDYTAPYGSDVWSVADGTVTDITATYGGSGGRMIHIDNDDGTGADYLHLSDSTSFVTLGQHVTQSQKIALSGASGYGDEHYYGAHLHISYRTIHGAAYTNNHNIDFDALVRSLGLT
jgi:murein DD-endopeptidase MepM/ murein hydrolase activator NlpD